MIFFTSEEKAVIRRYAIVCQLWREGDQDFLGLEYDMAAGCSILARRIAIDARSRHIIAADAGDRLPGPPMQVLCLCTLQKKQRLSPRTALCPEAERLSLRAPRHGGAASRRA